MTTMPGSLTEQWPQLPLEAWQEAYAALHLWTQIVGKIRMAQSAWCNHSWHVTFCVTPRGLSTSVIPHGAHSFQIDFDFVDHRLTVDSSHQARRSMPLESQSVAAYAYAYPEPAGSSQARVKPDGAFYSAEMHEFLLPYERVRESTNPDQTLLEFLQSTYEAAANLGRWDRLALELAPMA